MAPEPAARPARPAVLLSSVRRLTPVFLVFSVIPVTPLCCAFSMMTALLQTLRLGGIPGGQHTIARTERVDVEGGFGNVGEQGGAVVERERDGDVGALVLGLGQQRRRSERAVSDWLDAELIGAHGDEVTGVAEDVVAADEAGHEFGAGMMED